MNRRSTSGPQTAASGRFAWHAAAHRPSSVTANKPRSEAVSAGHEKAPPVGFEPTHTAPERIPRKRPDLHLPHHAEDGRAATGHGPVAAQSG
jgi:hypothetical protein